MAGWQRDEGLVKGGWKGVLRGGSAGHSWRLAVALLLVRGLAPANIGGAPDQRTEGQDAPQQPKTPELKAKTAERKANTPELKPRTPELKPKAPQLKLKRCRANAQGCRANAPDRSAKLKVVDLKRARTVLARSECQRVRV